MRAALIVVVAFFLTWVVLATIGFITLRWRLSRANRVSPAVRSPAPLWWLWAPSRVARLHRRLRAAVALIHLAPSRRNRGTHNLSVDGLRRELEYLCVEFDRHLLVAARHPRVFRRGLLSALESQITDVEGLAMRLSALTRPPGTPVSGWAAPETPPELLERLSTQIDLLDAAEAELAEIEWASGLVGSYPHHTGDQQGSISDPAPPPGRA